MTQIFLPEPSLFMSLCSFIFVGQCRLWTIQFYVILCEFITERQESNTTEGVMFVCKLSNRCVDFERSDASVITALT